MMKSVNYPKLTFQIKEDPLKPFHLGSYMYVLVYPFQLKAVNNSHHFIILLPAVISFKICQKLNFLT